MTTKPRLSFWDIWNMNVGFLGIQFSFGLQQTAINPIFSFLGALPEELPLLNLAGPVTGLLVQPIIGALSDKTWSPKWGRRKPYFLIGALIGSLSLFAFPYSPTLWFAVVCSGFWTWVTIWPWSPIVLLSEINCPKSNSHWVTKCKVYLSELELYWPMLPSLFFRIGSLQTVQPQLGASPPGFTIRFSWGLYCRF